uniref:Uncharacterized protein n=1 Tax=Rhizophora mucronata TaxID=61149 RepID=A0A2P2JRZ8_RHIMU
MVYLSFRNSQIESENLSFPANCIAEFASQFADSLSTSEMGVH